MGNGTLRIIPERANYAKSATRQRDDVKTIHSTSMMKGRFAKNAGIRQEVKIYETPTRHHMLPTSSLPSGLSATHVVDDMKDEYQDNYDPTPYEAPVK